MPSPGEALDIRYVRNGDVSIAYHVVGDAPTDLVLVPDFFSNLVYDWEAEHWRPFYERLAQSFRLILFDKRGTGLSDRGPLFPNLETRMEDVRAVLDAVGSQRAVIFGGHEGSTMACLYAATYPERTVALVMWQASAFESRRQPDVEQELLRLRDGWGTLDYAGEMLDEICPTLAENPAEREWFANRMRVGASPAAGYALNRMWSETDLRDILSAIHVPTLVLARGDLGEQEAGPVVERIRNSRYVRIAGDDYWGMFLSPEIVEEIERFVDTLEHAPEPETVLGDRPLHRSRRARPSERPSSATVDGPSYSLVTTPRSDSSSHASAAARSTLPATGSSRASTDRPGRSAALAPSPS